MITHPHSSHLQIRLLSVQLSPFGIHAPNDDEVPSIKRIHCSGNDVDAYGRDIFFTFELCSCQ